MRRLYRITPWSQCNHHGNKTETRKSKAEGKHKMIEAEVGEMFFEGGGRQP